MDRLEIIESNIVLEINDELKEYVKQVICISFSKWVLQGELAKKEYHRCNDITYYKEVDSIELHGMYSTLLEWNEEQNYFDENVEEIYVQVYNAILVKIKLILAPDLTEDDFMSEHGFEITDKYDWELNNIASDLRDEIGKIKTAEAFEIGRKAASDEITQDLKKEAMKLEQSRKNLELAKELEKRHFSNFLSDTNELTSTKPFAGYVSSVLRILNQEQRNALAEHGLPNANLSYNIERKFRCWMIKGRVSKSDRKQKAQTS